MGTRTQEERRQAAAIVARHAHLVDVASMVWALMARYKLTQVAVANELGVSNITVWRWLHGHKAQPLHAAKLQAVVLARARRAGRTKLAA